jgi:hypothetical protein
MPISSAPTHWACCSLLLAVSGTALPALDRDKTGILADGIITNIDLLPGVRLTSSDLGDGVDDILPSLGIQYQVRKSSWLFAPQFGVAFAQGEGDDWDVRTRDFWAGMVAVVGEDNGWRGEFGGGLIYSELDSHVLFDNTGGVGEERHRAFGPYVQAGFRYPVTYAFDAGLIGRYQYQPVDSDSFGDDTEIGGVTIWASLGLRF